MSSRYYSYRYRAFSCYVIIKANTSFQAHIIKDAPIPVGGALIVIGGDQKVVLEAADEMRVKGGASASLSAVVSILEQT